MKLLGSFVLFTSALAGPTRPPHATGAIECPTECTEELEKSGFRGARPDYDYGEDCDIDAFHKKCQEEAENPAPSTPEVSGP